MPARKGTSKPSDIRKYMKKTTKKGAYRKPVKKVMQKRRAPFVETKNRTHEELGLITADVDPQPTAANLKNWITNPMPTGADVLVDNDDAYTHFVMQSFLSMSRGFNENEMIGNSVYGRYLNAKFQFTFPRDTQGWTVPVDLELIHGWVTVPIGNTSVTRVGTGAAPINIDTWTRSNTSSYISEKVKEFFNERRDKLQWIPKQITGLNILKRQKIRPNLNKSLSVQITPVGDNGTTMVGSLPDVYKNLSWKINRKIHYVTGTSPAAVQQGSPADAQQFCYPNHSWLPFVVLFNPNFAEIAGAGGDNTKISVRHNNIFYYSDS